MADSNNKRLYAGDPSFIEPKAMAYVKDLARYATKVEFERHRTDSNIHLTAHDKRVLNSLEI